MRQEEVVRLQSLFPPAVRWRVRSEPGRDDSLFPAESAVVAGAVPARQREFAAVRDCARQALADLGRAPAPILPGPAGAPVWPAGIVGSMTHCHGFAAAAVAIAAAGVRALGLDAEPAEPLPTEVLEVVLLPAERRQVDVLRARHPDVCWDRLVFSAKESVYKAVNPISRAWLDFEDVIVRFDPAGSGFVAEVDQDDVPVELRRLAGRWVQLGGHVVTAVVS